MNSSKQENSNELKVISKIEINTKPKGYSEKDAGSFAKLSYVHSALDKLIKELNKGFVPKLDEVLHNNNDFTNQLNNTLTTEKSKLAGLIRSVGNSNEGLIKDLKDLQGRIENLENAGKGNDDFDWEAPRFKGYDGEFMSI
jgi:hypothetical protein